MPEYLSPGVYIEEVNTGNRPIEGVATSTCGFLGVSERGPSDGRAHLITSFNDYQRQFGGYVANRFLAYAVEGFFQNGGRRCFVARVSSDDGAAAAATFAQGDMLVSALGVGTWADDRLAIRVSNAGLHNPADVATLDLFNLTVFYWGPGVSGLPNPPLDPADPANLQDPNYRAPTLSETYENLSPDPLSPNFYVNRVNNRSTLIRLTQTGPTRPGNTAGLEVLGGGNDGATLDLTDINNAMTALEEVDEIAILCCPEEGINDATADFSGVTAALVQQCELLKDRFAILQAPQNAPPVANHQPPTPSKYAAYYYPWVRILDPVSSQELEVPPGGHVAGIYARSDIERGVHKAPANEVVRGLVLDVNDPTRGLQFQVTKGPQDVLNPRGINVLRYFPGRGNLVWGARTASRDPQWKYVNVRRLFIFVEESIEEATQWAVFEPNDEPLWAQIRRSVSGFLNRLWIDGMLQGRSAEEAYFVRCDRTTMTQDDIDNGRLIVLIGMAPVKPAEFVIFRIGQWAGGSEVSEG